MTKFDRGSQLAKSLAWAGTRFWGLWLGDLRVQFHQSLIRFLWAVKGREQIEYTHTLQAEAMVFTGAHTRSGGTHSPKWFQPGCWYYCFLKDTCAWCQHLTGACLEMYLSLWTFAAKNDVCYTQMTFISPHLKGMWTEISDLFKNVPKFSSGLQTHYLENMKMQPHGRGL